MVFNLAFANNTILSCYFLFLLIIDSYFLILAVIAQTFNTTAELAMEIEIQTNKAKAKIKTNKPLGTNGSPNRK